MFCNRNADFYTTRRSHRQGSNPYNHPPVTGDRGIRTDIPKSQRRGRPTQCPASISLRSDASISTCGASKPELNVALPKPLVALPALPSRQLPASLNPVLLAALTQLAMLLTLLLRDAEPRSGIRVSIRMFSRLISRWQMPEKKGKEEHLRI